MRAEGREGRREGLWLVDVLVGVRNDGRGAAMSYFY